MGEKGLAVFDEAAWLAAVSNTLRFQKIVEIHDENRRAWASSRHHAHSHFLSYRGRDALPYARPHRGSTS